MNKTKLAHTCLREADSLAILTGLFSNAPVGFQIFQPDGKSIFQAEQRFRLLIEHSSDMISLIDAEGNLTYSSPSSNRILRGGVNFEGKSAFEYVHPDDVQKSVEVLQKVKDNPGIPIFNTVRLKTAAGHYIITEGVLTNLLHVPGINAIVVNFRDVTERRQMEQKLIERESHLLASQRIAHIGSWELDLSDLDDLNRNRLLWSDECYRIFGYEPGQVVATNDLFFSAIPPEEHALIQAAITQAIETGKPYDIEHRIVLPDGKERIVHERSDLLCDPETGKPLKMIGTVQDITERKLDEEKLRKTERLVQEQYALLKGIIGNFDSPLFSVDTKYRYTSFNPAHAASAKLLYGADLQIGKRAFDGVDNPNDLQRFHEKLARSMKGETLSEEFHVGNIEAPEAWLEGLSCPIKNDQGEIIGVSVYYKNITRRRQAEEEIRRLNACLEQRVQERTAELESFMYTVSHDLRAPLRIIDAFSQLLIKKHGDKLGREAQEFLNQIQGSSKWMGQIIEGLLTLSRMTCRDIKRTPVNLSDLFRSLASKLQTTQPERKVDFIIEPALTVKADANMMQVLLENLLENSWKYSSKHAQARIELGIAEVHGEQVYFVRDDGAGFDMAQADRLFQSFQRLHAQAEFEGTGIGLATVQRIVQRHGGRVWAEGAVEKGATIYFTLPGKKLPIEAR